MKNKFLLLFLCTGIFLFNSCDDEEVAPTADLKVSLSVSDLTPAIGATITFTVVAHNDGPDNATGVDVTNNLPTGYTLVSNTATVGTFTDRAWTIGSLASGASATLTLVYTVKPEGTYPYTVSILGAEADDDVLNNSGLATIVPETLPPAKVTYTADVKPLLVLSCSPCHVAGGPQRKWDVYATTKSNISEIIIRVSKAQGTAGFMPQGGTKLSSAQIALLNKWVADGTLE